MFMCKVGIECTAGFIVKIYLAQLIENWTRSIEARANCFFVEFSNSAQARLTCKVLCFALSIKGKTLATFLCCCLCCVYESFVRSRGVCLHTYLGFPISRLMSRAWWSFSCYIKSLKKHKWEYLWLLWIQERSSP